VGKARAKTEKTVRIHANCFIIPTNRKASTNNVNL